MRTTVATRVAVEVGVGRRAVVAVVAQAVCGQMTTRADRHVDRIDHNVSRAKLTIDRHRVGADGPAARRP